MIQGIIIVNNHGKPRLTKFYQQSSALYALSEPQQQTIIRQIFTQISSRPDSFCNYLELDNASSDMRPMENDVKTSKTTASDGTPSNNNSLKLIYRHYATLYFVFIVDRSESDLGILDLIQVFVESLDKSFENVCELDLIFHSDRVHYILDEIIMGGMVLETNIGAILQSIKDQSKLHSQSLTQAEGTTSTSDNATSSWQYNW